MLHLLFPSIANLSLWYSKTTSLRPLGYDYFLLIYFTSKLSLKS